MWNRYHQTQDFKQPWLLRFFDQIKFYEVSPEELTHIREALPKGQVSLKIEETQFSLNEYQAFLEKNKTEISSFVESREQAFEEELTRWKENGQLTFEPVEAQTLESDEFHLPENCQAMDSPVSGSVWQCKVNAGDTVAAGDVLMILESMKMEIEIHATQAGTVNSVLKQQGQSVSAGQPLVIIEEHASAELTPALI